jgi:hypothetical protein
MSKEPESNSDLLNDLLDRMQTGTADELDRRMRESPEIKIQEESASQQRLEEMWMKEYERQQAVAASQAQQKRQEEKLIRYALIGAALVILIAIILVLILDQLGGAAPIGNHISHSILCLLCIIHTGHAYV